jgi:NAD(P)H-flavin reductase
MLRAVAEWAKERSVSAQVSLEERMGCGYGACVGCTIEIKSAAPDGGEGEPDNTKGNTKGTVLFVSPGDQSGTTHLSTVRRKICKDGPVFPADVIIW